MDVNFWKKINTICTLCVMMTISSLSFSQGDKNEITLLLIGNSGAGKTTAINALVAALLDPTGQRQILVKETFHPDTQQKFPEQERIEHDREYYNVKVHNLKEVVDEDGQQEEDESQTGSIRCFQFTTVQGLTVNILDSPGLWDTRGETVSQNIYDALQEHIYNHPLDAILVMVDASEATNRKRLIYKQNLINIISLFPIDSVNNRVFFLLNHEIDNDKLRSKRRQITEFFSKKNDIELNFKTFNLKFFHKLYENDYAGVNEIPDEKEHLYDIKNHVYRAIHQIVSSVGHDLKHLIAH